MNDFCERLQIGVFSDTRTCLCGAFGKWLGEGRNSPVMVCITGLCDIWHACVFPSSFWGVEGQKEWTCQVGKLECSCGFASQMSCAIKLAWICWSNDLCHRTRVDQVGDFETWCFCGIACEMRFACRLTRYSAVILVDLEVFFRFYCGLTSDPSESFCWKDSCKESTPKIRLSRTAVKKCLYRMTFVKHQLLARPLACSCGLCRSVSHLPCAKDADSCEELTEWNVSLKGVYGLASDSIVLQAGCRPWRVAWMSFSHEIVHWPQICPNLFFRRIFFLRSMWMLFSQIFLGRWIRRVQTLASNVNFTFRCVCGLATDLLGLLCKKGADGCKVLWLARSGVSADLRWREWSTDSSGMSLHTMPATKQHSCLHPSTLAVPRRDESTAWAVEHANFWSIEKIWNFCTVLSDMWPEERKNENFWQKLHLSLQMPSNWTIDVSTRTTIGGMRMEERKVSPFSPWHRTSLETVGA